MQVRHNPSANSMLTVWAASAREQKCPEQHGLDESLVQSLVRNISGSSDREARTGTHLDVRG
jgi:hypothetical protein